MEQQMLNSLNRVIKFEFDDKLGSFLLAIGYTNAEFEEWKENFKYSCTAIKRGGMIGWHIMEADRLKDVMNKKLAISLSNLESYHTETLANAKMVLSRSFNNELDNFLSAIDWNRRRWDDWQQTLRISSKLSSRGEDCLQWESKARGETSNMRLRLVKLM